SANYCRLDNRIEGIIIINIKTLREASKKPSSLVPIQGAVGMKLVTKNPLAGHKVHTRRMGNEGPHVVRHDNTKLLHGMTPIGVGESSADGLRDRPKRCRCVDAAGCRKPSF